MTKPTRPKGALPAALLLILLALGLAYWNLQPLHGLQKSGVTPTACTILRRDENGVQTIARNDPNTLAALTASAKGPLPLPVGLAPASHDWGEGPLYQAVVAGYHKGRFQELCSLTVDEQGFAHGQFFRYRLFGGCWAETLRSLAP